MNLDTFTTDYLAWSAGVHRPNTVTANRQALRRFKTHVGGLDITAIGPRHADQFLSACRTSGLKATSVNNYYRHLKAAFTKAVAWELIPANPFAKVRPIRQEKTPPKFIPKEKVAAFLAGIEDEGVRFLLTAYLGTGRRRVELLSLTWADVDLKARTYRVNSTKAHLIKEFPINDVFFNVLAQLDVKGHDEGLVFPKWKPDTVTHVIKRELRRAGYPDLHLHHLRHSFAAAYLMNGGDLYALKELLGHSQINTTLIYSHLTKSHLEGECNRVTF